jgi:hypothetical protein
MPDLGTLISYSTSMNYNMIGKQVGNFARMEKITIRTFVISTVFHHNTNSEIIARSLFLSPFLQ